MRTDKCFCDFSFFYLKDEYTQRQTHRDKHTGNGLSTQLVKSSGKNINQTKFFKFLLVGKQTTVIN